MKNTNHSLKLTRGQTIAGLCYLPFYLVLWSVLLPGLMERVGLGYTVIRLNLCYFYLNFLIIAVLFHRSLGDAFQAILHGFWPFLQAIILGFALYYVLNLGVSILLLLVAPELVNPNDAAVSTLASENLRATVVCAVFLGPLVEETLVRGLIFGNLHGYSRLGAYVVSVCFFSAIHLWQYVGVATPAVLALCALQYVPGGVALAWTYEKSGNIWSAVALHVFVNALAAGLLS